MRRATTPLTKHRQECVIRLDPGILGVEPDISFTTSQKKRFQVVKGCPCYKEFGDEKICINNDSLVSITPIPIEPTLFSGITSLQGLKEFKTDREEMCYLSVIIDRGTNIVYCICKNEPLVINHQMVKATDLSSALRFLTLTGYSVNDAFCSSCLYKYIVTMGDVFDNVVSKSERTRITIEYIREIALNILNTLQDGSIELHEDAIKTLVERCVQEIIAQLKEYTQLTVEYKHQMTDELQALIKMQKQLCRYHANILFQIETVLCQRAEQVTTTQVKHMATIAERIVGLDDSVTRIAAALEATNEGKRLMTRIQTTSMKTPIVDRTRFEGLMKTLIDIGEAIK